MVLSSKTLLKVLGTESFKRMKESNIANNTFTFLVLLSRDVPNYQFCYDCRVLHKGIPGIRQNSLRSFEGSGFGIRRAVMKMLRNAILQKISQKAPPYRAVAKGLWYLRFNWHQLLDGFHCIDTWYTTHETHQKHIFYRQINNTMFERVQRLILLPWNDFGTHSPFPRMMHFWLPCCRDTTSQETTQRIWQALYCRSLSYHKFPNICKKPPAEVLYQCLQCMTEHQVSSFSESLVAFVEHFSSGRRRLRVTMHSPKPSLLFPCF